MEMKWGGGENEVDGKEAQKEVAEAEAVVLWQRENWGSDELMVKSMKRVYEHKGHYFTCPEETFV